CDAAMGGGRLDLVNWPILARDGTVKDGEGIVPRVANLARQQQVQVRAVSGGVSVCDSRFGISGQETRAEAAARLPLLLVLGASTGGPEALACVLRALPASF